jgi:hypothetical protein
MTDTIEVLTNEDGTQQVTVTKEPPVNVFPAEQYVVDLTNEINDLQAKLDEKNAKLYELTSGGVDVAGIQASHSVIIKIK